MSFQFRDTKLLQELVAKLAAQRLPRKLVLTWQGIANILLMLLIAGVALTLGYHAIENPNRSVAPIGFFMMTIAAIFTYLAITLWREWSLYRWGAPVQASIAGTGGVISKRGNKIFDYNFYDETGKERTEEASTTQSLSSEDSFIVFFSPDSSVPYFQNCFKIDLQE
jgi:hypothetical protein